MNKLLTLVLVEKEGKVLLGMKKRGFGVGRWNGFGGKVEEGETLKEAAIRETREEAEIIPLSLKEVGVLEFSWQERADTLEVHVFRVNEFTGKPQETEEMLPRWFEFENIPYNHMWPDDLYWLPLLLENKTFKGSFKFDENDQILSQVLEVVK